MSLYIRKQVGFNALALFTLLFAFSIFRGDLANASDHLTLEQHTGEVIRLDGEVASVATGDPEIADVQYREQTPNVATIFAKKPGTTTFLAINARGDIVRKLTITVTHNIGRLKQILRSVAPDENFRVHSSPEGLILDGEVSDARYTHAIEKIATQFLGGKQTIVNNLTVATPTQVLIKVKIAEIRRTVLNRLDINWTANINTGNFNFGILTGRDPGTTTGSITGFTRANGLDSYGFNFQTKHTQISTLIDALDQEQMATILAEPNLVALSGETASFLSGGELPVPVPTGDNVAIEYKPFGISLSFTPTVMARGLINLRVRPEVSAIDDTLQTEIVLRDGNVAKVSGFTNKRAETSVELASGQSLAIAGLFSNTMANEIKEFPGLGDLPILGALFRSSQFRRDESELVIIVTPYIIKPSATSDFALPMDSLRYATHLEMILFNRLNSVDHFSGDDGAMAANDDMRLEGASGFHVE